MRERKRRGECNTDYHKAWFENVQGRSTTNEKFLAHICAPYGFSSCKYSKLHQSILASRTIVSIAFVACMRANLLYTEVMPQGIELENTPILILYLHYQASTKQHVFIFGIINVEAEI